MTNEKPCDNISFQLIIIINKNLEISHPAKNIRKGADIFNQRKTIQKQIILDAIRSVDTHPSVEELYSEIHKKHPSISKATIYRNVRQLAEKGIILHIAVANDVSRYDGCTDFHQHFICNICGKVFDINIDQYQDHNNNNDYERLGTAIQNKYGYKVDRCMISFVGVCLGCVEIL